MVAPGDARKTTPPVEPVAQALTIVMASPGHWHFTHSKHLMFTVADASGKPVPGLAPQVTVRTLSGQVDRLDVHDHGDGSYGAEYTAQEIGTDYATGYAVAFVVSYQGEWYTSAWPVEVVRDGREDIFKGDGRYLYHVRYGWDPGRPVANDETPVDLYFEPRRAIEEGEQLDHKRPWRHPCNHLPGLTATVLVRSEDGQLSEEIPATYAGLGVYRAQRLFTIAEIGGGRGYLVSLIFTDPYNDQTISADDNAYALQVSAKGSSSEAQDRRLPGHATH